MQKDRDLSFDAFRGLAAIAVVAIHTAYLVGCDNNALVCYSQLLFFAVPVFIFISGYWAAQKQIGSLADYRAFLTKRFSRVLVPYLFWSFVWFGYEITKTHNVNESEMIFRLLLGQACLGYFFIIMLIQLYILTPLFQYANRRPFGVVLVIILSVISLLVLYFSRLFNVIWYLPASLLFYSWIIFYEIGLLAGDGNNKKTFIPKNIRFLILPAILISLLISEWEAMFILSKYDNLNFATSATKYSSVLYSVCVIFGFLLIRERIKYWPKFLVTLGTYSFGIYLIHVPVLKKVISVAQKSDTISSIQPLYQLVILSTTMLICFVLISITRKLLPKPFCSKVLGF